MSQPATKIFLIGFMGSGKSHWGPLWAKNTHLSFYDLDQQVEKSFRLSVQEIFEQHGEEKFREIERIQLRKFEAKKGFILSCGGGTPCYFDNMDWMKKQGLTIYLKTDPAQILERVMNEKEKRPLLKKVNTSELLFFIENKLAEREKFYTAAHHTLDTVSLQEDSLQQLLSGLN